MIREHKYRAWDKIINEWVYFTLEELCNEVGDFSIMKNWCQYTGLKDKKRTKEYPEGQEIYEGDVYKVEYNDTYDFAYYKVVYDSEEASFYCECVAMHHKEKGFKDISQGGYCNFCLSSRKGEVIGNIYDNMESK